MADNSIEDFLSSILDFSEYDKYKELEDTILYPLLDEIELLISDSVKEFVRSVLVRAPGGFWEAPGSQHELMNPPDEHGPGGHIIHVKRLVRCAFLLAEAQNYDPQEQDLLIAAALISGVTKFIPVEDSYIMDPMYPYTVDRYIQQIITDEIKQMTTLHEPNRVSTTLLIDSSDIDSILRLVRCHMGRYSAIPETFPKTLAEWTLHFADILTTKMHYIIDGDEVLESRWIE